MERLDKFIAAQGGHPWVEEFSKFKEAHYHPNRLIETLFNNSDFVSQNVNPINLMSGLYSIAVSYTHLDVYKRQTSGRPLLFRRKKCYPE